MNRIQNDKITKVLMDVIIYKEFVFLLNSMIQ